MKYDVFLIVGDFVEIASKPQGLLNICWSNRWVKFNNVKFDKALFVLFGDAPEPRYDFLSVDPLD